MSLAKQIAARMLAKKTAAAAPTKPTPPPDDAPIKCATFSREPIPADVRARMDADRVAAVAERGRRIAEGHKRRNEPVALQPAAVVDDSELEHDDEAELEEPASVPTSAPIDPVERTITERPPALPPVPPRPELEFNLVKGLEAVPLPAAPAEPERLAPNLATGFRGSCKAVNADTGKQCALLAGHTTSHRHGQTAFIRVAHVDQKSFTRRDLLDAAASASPGAGGGMFDAKSMATEKRESRERLNAGVRLRKSSEANTTTNPEAS